MAPNKDGKATMLSSASRLKAISLAVGPGMSEQEEKQAQTYSGFHSEFPSVLNGSLQPKRC
jgi:hypothetical protein